MIQALKSFSVRSLTVKGFKGFADETTFSFGDMNTITGHNGQGKTSIADAIAFAITGVPFYGGAKLDHLYCQNTRDILVDMEFTDETGAVRRLTRQRVNDNMDILLDGCRITQRDLTVMFMERDLFLSMFNPRYFIDVLGSKGRDLLERYLPEVPHEKIMSALSSHDRELLENQQFLSAEAFAKKLREEISQLDRDIIYNQGKRDLQADQMEVCTGRLAEKQQRHAQLTAEANELEARRTTGFDGSSLNVYPAAGTDRNYTDLLLGDASLFTQASGTYESGFDRGVRIHPEKGTFELAVRLKGQLRQAALRLRWFAWRAEEHASHQLPAGTLLRLEPDVTRVAPGAEVNFIPVFEQGLGAPCDFLIPDKQSGVITENGIYTAPEKDGLYQVCAQIKDRPETRVNAFVIVRRWMEGAEHAAGSL